MARLGTVLGVIFVLLAAGLLFGFMLLGIQAVWDLVLGG